jgi:virulence factor Mce-like protein
MARIIRSRLLRTLALSAGFLAVVVAGTGFQRLALVPSQYTVRVPVQDAAGIYPGSDVMIAGARAGTVQDISLGSDGLAMITAGIDDAYAPVHQDASVALRPKSLLGEMYVALDPGRAPATLASGATLSRLQVNRATSLEDVVNTFDQPTRDKLQTVIVELGGGVAGRGQELNSAIPYGSKDLDALASVASTLAERDQELRTVIQDLDTVLGELAQSDRRQQLSQLIQNTELLLHNLVQQETQIKQAVTTTNAALGRLAAGLNGTQGSLDGIARALPTTVREGGLILSQLGTDTDVMLPNLDTLIQGIQRGPVVFGGRDASGYATRISLVVGCGSVSVCPALTGSQTPSAPAGSSPAGNQPNQQAGTMTDQELVQHGLFGFLLGGN